VSAASASRPGLDVLPGHQLVLRSQRCDDHDLRLLTRNLFLELRIFHVAEDDVEVDVAIARGHAKHVEPELGVAVADHHQLDGVFERRVAGDVAWHRQAVEVHPPAFVHRADGAQRLVPAERIAIEVVRSERGDARFLVAVAEIPQQLLAQELPDTGRDRLAVACGPGRVFLDPRTDLPRLGEFVEDGDDVGRRDEPGLEKQAVDQDVAGRQRDAEEVFRSLRDRGEAGCRGCHVRPAPGRDSTRSSRESRARASAPDATTARGDTACRPGSRTPSHGTRLAETPDTSRSPDCRSRRS
jgi:hypothetical protein